MSAPCHQGRLTIAGVQFAMTCEAVLSAIAPAPAYTDFTSEAPASHDIDIPVVLLPRPVEGLARVERQFDAEGMWSLFRDGETRYVTHTGWGIDAPLWSAELALDAASVRIHCGGVLVQEGAGGTVLSSPLRYPLDQLLLTYVLARREGTIIHAAGLECGGKLWLLAGRSGAGKSTASALLRGRSEIGLVSDDRIVVRRTGGSVMGYGTPWPGEARVAANRRAPLGGILFLVQSDTNRIRPLSATQTLERLMPVTSIPWYEPELFPDVLSFCGELAEAVPAYDFHFRPDRDAADVLADFVTVDAYAKHQVI